ncbi:cellobiose transport system substrate-binding protein [Paenibacillus sp. V4I3]|uniref:ABC transporter substrate-binding protein n=1 Tax=unclassified Paenibacillus TaxID=185978 RepID=UPI0027860D3A|nr:MULTISPECIES: extracellular solute-binding protein [unclassified Paenibacillus]MDQ0873627.1 cellobiose transport system substrate-binding protein [Paenibacillus sp. V4I3]MDQ0890443.1 cellobiose transport system substrate-binding protein [Paenibacillus sp. V4I9]
MMALPKLFLRISLVLAMISLLCSCSPEMGMPSVKSSPKPSTLRIWLWPGSGLEPLIKKYEAENPQMDVEMVTFQYDDVVPSLMTSLATKADSPDLVLLEASQLNQLKRFQNQFYNLYDYGDERVHYLDWKWRQAESKNGGFLYAMPVDIGPVALAYRHDLFQEAGLPTEREEVAAYLSDWDALEQAGVLLKQRTGAVLFDNITNIFLSYLNQFDGQYVLPVEHELSPHVKEAWDRAVYFQKRGLSAGLPSQTSSWAEGAVNRKFALVLAPSWLHGMMKKNAPATAGKWDLTRAPGLPSNLTGTYLAVPKTSSSPHAAYKLASWLTAPQQQLANFIGSGNFPSTPESYSSSNFLEVHDSFFNDAPVGQIYSYTALRYKSGYDDYDYTTIERWIRDGLRRVESDGADPDLTWKGIMQQFETLNHVEEGG